MSIAGGQRPAVRIQANPQALAAHGLNLEALRAAVAGANVNQPKGNFDGPERSFMLDANDQLRSPDAYRNLIIAYRDGAPLRLSDVAEVVDGAENRRLAAWANELPAVLVNIQRQPGANVIDVVDRIQRLLPQLTSTLPSTLDVVVISNRTETIRASVRDVQHELIFAVALVVMVTFLFLRNIPATLIPSVVVPLSLVGTFGVMYLAGFSINNLTLMALTIATGFVVDDAIVMVENIARHLEEGQTPFEAALLGAKEISFTLVSLTISLIAVLIPLLFMADVVGRLFASSLITLAVSILISLGRLADADAHDERAAAATPQERGRELVLPQERRGARLDYRGLWTATAVGPAAPAADAAGGPGHARADGRALSRGPEGLLPRAGHGCDSGDQRSAAVGVVFGDGRTTAGRDQGDPRRAGRDRVVVLHRRGRQQPDAQQRPDAHHAEVARPAHPLRRPRSSPACASACRPCRASRCISSRYRT